MRWLESITNSMDMNLSKLQETVGQGSMVYYSPRESQRVKHNQVCVIRHNLSTEQQQVMFLWGIQTEERTNQR